LKLPLKPSLLKLPSKLLLKSPLKKSFLKKQSLPLKMLLMKNTLKPSKQPKKLSLKL
jgi:hypothetical protein